MKDVDLETERQENKNIRRETSLSLACHTSVYLVMAPSAGCLPQSHEIPAQTLLSLNRLAVHRIH